MEALIIRSRSSIGTTGIPVGYGFVTADTTLPPQSMDLSSSTTIIIIIVLTNCRLNGRLTFVLIGRERHKFATAGASLTTVTPNTRRGDHIFCQAMVVVVAFSVEIVECFLETELS